ncbi:MAG: cysteine synthase A [Candidatus Margulisiibacteriota bacterium]
MSINVTINGKKEKLDSEGSLGRLLAARNIRPEVVTVELNDKIINRNDFDSITLKEGDRLEFVYYMGGGAVADLIGKTPIIKLERLTDDHAASVYAKLEFFNPGGSVKDRICRAMIEDAEKRCLLKPGGTIVEPTSGNTGIGLALIGASRGYKVILTMPETMSLERIYILRSYGAEVVLTSGSEGMTGSIKKAEELVKKTGGFMPQQFNNPANPEVHRKTTAVEILEALGENIDALVAGVGTGGTLTGVGEVLKAKNPAVKIIAVEPAASAVLSGGKAGPHKIQGIGAGFVPRVLNRGLIDEVIKVKDEDAFQTAKRLAQEEGLFVGISSGAAAWAALKVARDLGPKKVVITIFPDTGERYFSMQQFFEG